MARLPFVDTHVHYWDLRDPSLRYEWLDARLGASGPRQHRRDQGAALHGAETSSPRPASRTSQRRSTSRLRSASPTRSRRRAWLQAQADETGLPARDRRPLRPRRAERAGGARAPSRVANLRGIRDFGQGDYLVDPAWQRGYGLLARHGLVFCIDPTRRDDGQGRGRSRERYPDVDPVHRPRGLPARARRRVLRALAARAWRGRRRPERGLQDLAASACATTPGRSRAGARGCTRCLELFGVERCFFGTNWPVDRLYSSYGDVLDAYEELIADLTAASRWRSSRRTPSGSSGSRPTLDGQHLLAAVAVDDLLDRPRCRGPAWSAGRPSRRRARSGSVTSSCCIGLRSGLNSKSLKAGELKLIARLAAVHDRATTRQCAFAWRR